MLVSTLTLPCFAGKKTLLTTWSIFKCGFFDAVYFESTKQKPTVALGEPVALIYTHTSKNPTSCHGYLE